MSEAARAALVARVYDEQEQAAFRAISQRVWNQPYKPGAGPSAFATGDAWPELLRGMADRAEREAYHLRVAARAMDREIKREQARDQPLPGSGVST